MNIGQYLPIFEAQATSRRATQTKNWPNLKPLTQKMATQKLKPHGAELHKNWREFCVPIKDIGVVWIPEVIRLHHERP